MTIAFTAGRTGYRHFAIEHLEDGHKLYFCQTAHEARHTAYEGNLRLGLGLTYVGVGHRPT